MSWTLFDFTLFFGLIVVLALIYKLVTKVNANFYFRSGLGLMLVTAFLLVWITLAIGFFGSEDDWRNVLIVIVLGICGVGTFLSRFKSERMPAVLIASAVAQAVAVIIARPSDEIVWLASFVFVLLWLGAAWLFRKASIAH